MGKVPDPAELERSFDGCGLVPLGMCTLRSGEILNNPGEATVVLVGNAGPAMWEVFSRRADRNSEILPLDPLDQWTRQVVDPIAMALGARAIYPFELPHPPIQRWALQSGSVFQSPIGMLIHPEFGLWHAYRAALLFPGAVSTGMAPKVSSPCDDCVEKPCLSACPVGAFSADGYDVPACAGYLSSKLGGESCPSSGCAARNACPVGQNYRYRGAQIQFHMRAFDRAVNPE